MARPMALSVLTGAVVLAVIAGCGDSNSGKTGTVAEISPLVSLARRVRTP